MIKYWTLLLAICMMSCGSSDHRTASHPTEWKHVGIGGGGAQFYPAISPHDPNTVFMASDMTCSFVTYDGGESWRMFNLGSVSKF